MDLENADSDNIAYTLLLNSPSFLSNSSVNSSCSTRTGLARDTINRFAKQLNFFNFFLEFELASVRLSQLNNFISGPSDVEYNRLDRFTC
jgi:hypothetical protein